MLALLVVPFLVAIGFWIVSAWFLWDPVTGWFQTSFPGRRLDGPRIRQGLPTAWRTQHLDPEPVRVHAARAGRHRDGPCADRAAGDAGRAPPRQRAYPTSRAAAALASVPNLWNVLKSVVDLHRRLPADAAALADTAPGPHRAVAVVGLADGPADALRQPRRARRRRRARAADPLATAAPTWCWAWRLRCSTTFRRSSWWRRCCRRWFSPTIPCRVCANGADRRTRPHRGDGAGNEPAGCRMNRADARHASTCGASAR